jgi:two-component system LytT family response regulator
MEIVKNINLSENGKAKIHIKNHEGHLSINPSQILFCQAEGSYTRIVTEGYGTDVIVSKSLNKFHKSISDKIFLRCHNSYLINLLRVKSFSSKRKIIAFKGFNIPISRRKANQIFQILLNMGIHDVKYLDQL